MTSSNWSPRRRQMAMDALRRRRSMEEAEFHAAALRNKHADLRHNRVDFPQQKCVNPQKRWFKPQTCGLTKKIVS